MLGDTDIIIPFARSIEMADTLKHAGVRAKLLILPGIGHAFGYGILSEAQQTSIQRVKDFLDDVFWEKRP